MWLGCTQAQAVGQEELARCCEVARVERVPDHVAAGSRGAALGDLMPRRLIERHGSGVAGDPGAARGCLPDQERDLLAGRSRPHLRGARVDLPRSWKGRKRRAPRGFGMVHAGLTGRFRRHPQGPGPVQAPARRGHTRVERVRVVDTRSARLVGLQAEVRRALSRTGRSSRGHELTGPPFWTVTSTLAEPVSPVKSVVLTVMVWAPFARGRVEIE